MRILLGRRQESPFARTRLCDRSHSALIRGSQRSSSARPRRRRGVGASPSINHDGRRRSPARAPGEPERMIECLPRPRRLPPPPSIVDGDAVSRRRAAIRRRRWLLLASVERSARNATAALRRRRAKFGGSRRAHPLRRRGALAVAAARSAASARALKTSTALVEAPRASRPRRAGGVVLHGSRRRAAGRRRRALARERPCLLRIGTRSSAGASRCCAVSPARTRSRSGRRQYASRPLLRSTELARGLGVGERPRGGPRPSGSGARAVAGGAGAHERIASRHDGSAGAAASIRDDAS